MPTKKAESADEARQRMHTNMAAMEAEKQKQIKAAKAVKASETAKAQAERELMKKTWAIKKAVIDKAYKVAKKSKKLPVSKMTNDANDDVFSKKIPAPNKDAPIEEQALYFFKTKYIAWHNQDYAPGVSFGNEHFLLSDPEFQKDFYKRCPAKPNPSEWQALQKEFRHICQCKTPMQHTYKRIALLDDMLVYDHYNDKREVTIITAQGWHTTKESPVIFLRTPDMAEQCLPDLPPKLGNIDALNEFIRVQKNWEAMCIKAAVFKCFIPTAPNPVVGLFGDQGSGKTFLLEAIMQLVSPSKNSGLMSFPSSEAALIDMVRDNPCCAFDNVSVLSDRQSDALCKIATGIKDAEGNKVSGIVFLNGITNLFLRPDLVDRAIVIHTAKLEKLRRHSITLLWKTFNQKKPQIIAGIFDGISSYFRYRGAVKLDALPRMSDFAIMMTAAEDGLHWEKYSFIDAYTTATKNAAYDGLEENPIALAILIYMQHSKSGVEMGMALWWCQELKKINELASAIPDNPKSLSDAISRLKVPLAANGIIVEKMQRTANGRPIKITNINHKTTSTIHPEGLELAEDAGRDAGAEEAEDNFRKEQTEQEMKLSRKDD